MKMIFLLTSAIAAFLLVACAAMSPLPTSSPTPAAIQVPIGQVANTENWSFVVTKFDKQEDFPRRYLMEYSIKNKTDNVLQFPAKTMEVQLLDPDGFTVRTRYQPEFDSYTTVFIPPKMKYSSQLIVDSEQEIDPKKIVFPTAFLGSRLTFEITDGPIPSSLTSEEHILKPGETTSFGVFEVQYLEKRRTRNAAELLEIDLGLVGTGTTDVIVYFEKRGDPKDLTVSFLPLDPNHQRIVDCYPAGVATDIIPQGGKVKQKILFRGHCKENGIMALWIFDNSGHATVLDVGP